MTLLSTNAMSVTFGGLRAVDGVDLEVRAGQLVGLIGPNGAGKTTFIDGITGFVPTGGRIDFDGREITTEPPHQRSRLGLARTWQSLELFDDLTIRENLQVAAGFLVPGGIMFTMLDSVFGIPGEFAPILGGIGLILTAILNPEGIAGGFRLTTGRLLARRTSTPRVDVEPAVGVVAGGGR